MAISQCLADPRTLVQSGNCETGTVLSHCLLFSRISLGREFADHTHRLQSECQVIYVPHTRLLSIVSISTTVSMPALSTWWFPTFVNWNTLINVFLLFSLLCTPKICCTVCYICKGEWMKTSLFKIITPENLGVSLSVSKPGLGFTGLCGHTIFSPHFDRIEIIGSNGFKLFCLVIYAWISINLAHLQKLIKILIVISHLFNRF